MPNFKEIGRLGQKRYGGVFYEEFLTELRGHRGIAAYQEMADNDDIIGAILYSIEMLVRQTDWIAQPGGSRVCAVVHGRYAGHMERHHQRNSLVSDLWLVGA